MDNEIIIAEIENYVNNIIPKLEMEMIRPRITKKKKLELYLLYEDLLLYTAPHNFISFNKYLELDEDHNSQNKAFYHQRKDHLKEVFDAFNDMEIYNKYDILLVSMPPRVGKTTTGIRFLSWVIGRHPESTQLATSYSDNITSSFYNGVMEVIGCERYQKIFPESKLANQNAKRQEIWLRLVKRYPSIVFIPINGSMTGRGEAEKYLYCDDLVSGYEEALSVTRLEKLWGLYTVNGKQRKKEGCKEIHLATRWSVHDPLSKLNDENINNERCKIINISCFDENGESNFNFYGGFSTNYYRELERSLDKPSFNALYLQQPIERDGLLYNEDDMQWYMELPNEKPDTVIAICDSKNLGKDYVCSPVGYVYGDFVYIEDVVYNDGLPEVTRPAVGQKWLEHNVVRADVELNNGGNYYAEDLQEYLDSKGGKTSIRIFFSANNKKVKIITYADYVTKHFIFKHPSQYSPNSEYASFIRDLLNWTQKGVNKHDDAPDAIAMLAQMVQSLNGNAIKFLDRKKLGL